MRRTVPRRNCPEVKMLHATPVTGPLGARGCKFLQGAVLGGAKSHRFQAIEAHDEGAVHEDILRGNLHAL
jgi:hypothetical protein